MDTRWQNTFLDRIRSFEELQPPRPGDTAVSIKVRVVSGCFHRQHSPYAYELIDSELAKLPLDSRLVFEEHESGPELLVYLSVGAAGLSLAKSVIDLITTIIKARSEGVRKGDKPNDPVELIVRHTNKVGDFQEETILLAGHHGLVDAKSIEKRVAGALRDLTNKNDGNEG